MVAPPIPLATNSKGEAIIPTNPQCFACSRGMTPALTEATIKRKNSAKDQDAFWVHLVPLEGIA